MFKALLHHTYTKRDMYGNVYHTVRITNPRTEKFFTVGTSSLGNVEHILYSLFPECKKTGRYLFYTTKRCTDSARLSSLPQHEYLNECHPDNNWEKALRKIGYKIPKGNG